jgi:hypothetical protein
MDTVNTTDLVGLADAANELGVAATALLRRIDAYTDTDPFIRADDGHHYIPRSVLDDLRNVENAR